jgi:streptomycin 6-kinase
LGERGANWIKELDEVVAVLQSAWKLQLGDVLHGGCNSLVIRAITNEKEHAVLKICIPDYDIDTESRVLGLANGSGYARLLEFDIPLKAMLIEQLGDPLSRKTISAEEAMRATCATFKTAWIQVNDPVGLSTGAEFARWAADYVVEQWQLTGKPCSEATVDLLCDFAEERINAFTPERCVLVHGDAHAGNTLSCGDGSYRFIDPVGLFAERACDLGCLLCHSGALLSGDTAKLVRGQCHLLAKLCEVDELAIWHWGFIRRVLTGLVLPTIGMVSEAQKTLEVADRLVNA